jgi:hypothetical protein
MMQLPQLGGNQQQMDPLEQRRRSALAEQLAANPMFLSPMDNLNQKMAQMQQMGGPAYGGDYGMSMRHTNPGGGDYSRIMRHSSLADHLRRSG